MRGPHSFLDEDHQDVREYAAQKEIDEQPVLVLAMREKAEEFVANGGEAYQTVAVGMSITV